MTTDLLPDYLARPWPADTDSALRWCSEPMSWIPPDPAEQLRRTRLAFVAESRKEKKNAHLVNTLREQVGWPSPDESDAALLRVAELFPYRLPAIVATLESWPPEHQRTDLIEQLRALLPTPVAAES